MCVPCGPSLSAHQAAALVQVLQFALTVPEWTREQARSSGYEGHRGQHSMGRRVQVCCLH